jgi:hypothetical protein
MEENQSKSKEKKPLFALEPKSKRMRVTRRVIH